MSTTKLTRTLAAAFLACSVLPVQAQTAAPRGSSEPAATLPIPRANDAPSELRMPRSCHDLPAAMRDECLFQQRGGSASAGDGRGTPPPTGGSSLPPRPLQPPSAAPGPSRGAPGR